MKFGTLIPSFRLGSNTPSRIYQGASLVWSADTYKSRVLALNPIQYLPLNDTSGAVATDISGNGFHGVYNNVNLGQTGMGDGDVAPAFDAVNLSTVTGLLNDINSVWSASTGSVMIWARDTKGGAGSRYFAALHRDPNNLITLASNLHRLRAGGLINDINSPFIGSTWAQTVLTFSKAENTVSRYINGLLVSTIPYNGTFSGGLNRIDLGVEGWFPRNYLTGQLAHYAIWSRVLSAEEIASLASPT